MGLRRGLGSTGWVGSYKGQTTLLARAWGYGHGAGLVGDLGGVLGRVRRRLRRMERPEAIRPTDADLRAAPDGNVMLTGEIDLVACGGRFTLALGFGRDPCEAAYPRPGGRDGRLRSPRSDLPGGLGGLAGRPLAAGRGRVGPAGPVPDQRGGPAGPRGEVDPRGDHRQPVDPLGRGAERREHRPRRLPPGLAPRPGRDRPAASRRPGPATTSAASSAICAAPRNPTATGRRTCGSAASPTGRRSRWMRRRCRCSSSTCWIARACSIPTTGPAPGPRSGGRCNTSSRTARLPRRTDGKTSVGSRRSRSRRMIAAMLVGAEAADRNGEPAPRPIFARRPTRGTTAIEEWTYVEGTELAGRLGIEGYYLRIAPGDDRGQPLKYRGHLQDWYRSEPCPARTAVRRSSVATRWPMSASACARGRPSDRRYRGRDRRGPEGGDALRSVLAPLQPGWLRREGRRIAVRQQEGARPRLAPADRRVRPLRAGRGAARRGRTAAPGHRGVQQRRRDDPGAGLGRPRHPGARSLPGTADGIGHAAGLGARRVHQAPPLAPRRPRLRHAAADRRPLPGRPGDLAAAHLAHRPSTPVASPPGSCCGSS